MDNRKSNVHPALTALIVLAAVGVLWLVASGRVDTTPLTSALGLKSAIDKRVSISKPICSQVIVPVGDCIPQHLANLPPDPGPAGMLTLEGIDSDKDGVRDDLQRYIVEHYGHSERAVAALMLFAKTAQLQLLSADTVDREGAKKLGDQGMRAVACVGSADEKLIGDQAVTKVGIQLRNTPERLANMFKFELLAANQVYELPNESAPELCGFDPAKFAN